MEHAEADYSGKNRERQGGVVRQVRVRVPATSANLGSGFDCVGLALDYCDELTFARHGVSVGTPLSDCADGESSDSRSASAVAFAGGGIRGGEGSDTSATVIIHGEGEDTLPRDETHLVVSMFRRACSAFGLPRFGFTLEARNRIPQARGMGSSAEAIVAGVAAAAAFAGGGAAQVRGAKHGVDSDDDVDTMAATNGAEAWRPRSLRGIAIDRDSIFALAADAEGHPDNVAPAVYGGLTASWMQEAGEGVGSPKVAGAELLQTGFHTVGYPVSSEVRATVFVPDFELSTERARHALPAEVPYGSAVYNVSRAALLPAAMNCADADRGNRLLFAATQDMLHQPYRKSLMAPSWGLIEALRSQGFAAAVSGAGPCVLVLHYGDGDARIDAVASGRLQSGHWKVLHLPVNADGVSVEVR